MHWLLRWLAVDVVGQLMVCHHQSIDSYDRDKKQNVRSCGRCARTLQ